LLVNKRIKIMQKYFISLFEVKLMVKISLSFEICKQKY